MAKGAYIGVNNVAHKIKKGYIGVDGIARKIKKSYIGIGGVARPCWSGGELAYYGTITPLSVGRFALAATSIGNYALFGGGMGIGSSNIMTALDVVDAYNKLLTRSTPTQLSVSRSYLAATSVGNYALFGGGRDSINASATDAVDAYDKSLTRLTPTVLSKARIGFGATSIGDYALFAGSGGDKDDTVDAYDTSLTRSIPSKLNCARSGIDATSVGNYALFGGGYASGFTTSTVDAYDTSLTRTIATDLSVDRINLAATSVGNYALFGGGDPAGSYGDTSPLATVDAYDTSLTRTTPTPMSTARKVPAATSIGDYALFAGHTLTVDAYDTSLTRTTPTPSMNVYHALKAGATSIGDYALFAGGMGGNGSSLPLDAVDAYTVA